METSRAKAEEWHMQADQHRREWPQSRRDMTRAWIKNLGGLLGEERNESAGSGGRSHVDSTGQDKWSNALEQRFLTGGS